MGAWGANTFENDSALDWLGDLFESEDSALVKKTLQAVVIARNETKPASLFTRLLGRPQPTTNYLEADAASNALAAAEIVAAANGRPPSVMPIGLADWLQQHSKSVGPDLKKLAVDAVDAVQNKSELKELHEEGDASEWHRSINDLRSRCLTV